MKHTATAEEKEAIEFGEWVTLYRYICSCGWKGLWHSSEDGLMKSVQRHIDATREGETE